MAHLTFIAMLNRIWMSSTNSEITKYRRIFLFIVYPQTGWMAPYFCELSFVCCHWMNKVVFISYGIISIHYFMTSNNLADGRYLYIWNGNEHWALRIAGCYYYLENVLKLIKMEICQPQKQLTATSSLITFDEQNKCSQTSNFGKVRLRNFVYVQKKDK